MSKHNQINQSINELSISTKRSNFWRLMGYFKPYWKLLLVSVLFALAINGAVILKPYIFKLVIDDHISKGDFSSSAIFNLAAMYLGIVIIGSIFTYFQSVLLIWIGQKITFTIRADLFRHVQSMSLTFFDKMSSGRILTRITNDVEALNDLFSGLVVNIFRDLIMIIGIVIMMFALDTRLAWISIGCIPLIAIATTLYRIAARKNFVKLKGMIARINGFLAENISGMKLVQIFHREKEKLTELEDLDKEYFNYSLRDIMLNGFSRPVVDVINNITIAALLLFSYKYVDKSIVSAGVLFAFITYIRQFFEPISTIAEQYTTMQSSFISAERIFEILDTKDTVESFDNGDNTLQIKGTIEFRNVWFAYDNENWILKDLSFTIKAGETVAFVGSTGSGKTTIISLIARFYEIQKGMILLDGKDIRMYNFRSLRKQISVVMQDVFLFSGDIRSNIRLNNSDISDTSIYNSIKTVHADSFVKSLPNGLNERVFERGCTFSSGQKQLISFARAIVSNPAVLVLDEATSTIDTHTEKCIQEGLDELCKERTSIIIAHRLSTIRKANRIIVIQKGTVVESGSHDELISQSGIYAKMHITQTTVTE